MWFAVYKTELGAQTFPFDGPGKTAPYPILDRWSDTFNLSTEFVVTNLGRALGASAWLMARTPLRDQKWKAAPGEITGVPASAKVDQRVTLRVNAPGLDLADARIVWEGRDNPPVFGAEFAFTPKQPGEQWVEVDAQLPDGRRVVAVATFNAAGK